MTRRKPTTRPSWRYVHVCFFYQQGNKADARNEQAFQDEFSVSSKFVLEHEFDTYSNLDFSLYVPCWELMPHLKRIFQLADVNSLDEYGGGWEGWAGSAI